MTFTWDRRYGGGGRAMPAPAPRAVRAGGDGLRSLSSPTVAEAFGQGPQPGEADGACELEQNAADQVDGMGAEGVGRGAAKSEGGQPPGLPDHVEPGEHPPAIAVRDFGCSNEV